MLCDAVRFVYFPVTVVVDMLMLLSVETGLLQLYKWEKLA